MNDISVKVCNIFCVYQSIRKNDSITTLCRVVIMRWKIIRSGVNQAYTHNSGTATLHLMWIVIDSYSANPVYSTYYPSSPIWLSLNSQMLSHQRLIFISSSSFWKDEQYLTCNKVLIACETTTIRMFVTYTSKRKRHLTNCQISIWLI